MRTYRIGEFSYSSELLFEFVGDNVSERYRDLHRTLVGAGGHRALGPLTGASPRSLEKGLWLSLAPRLSWQVSWESWSVSRLLPGSL